MSFRSILGGPTWLPLAGRVVRVREFTIGGLIEMGAWCATKLPHPLDLPPHDDPAIRAMAAIVRARQSADMESLGPPRGIDPAAWWGTALAITTDHPESMAIGEWIAGDGEALQAEVRCAWLGISPEKRAVSTLDAIEGLEYPPAAQPEIGKAVKSVVDRCHCTPAEILGMSITQFWETAAGFPARSGRRPLNQDRKAFHAGRKRLAKQAKAWLETMQDDGPPAEPG